MMPEIPRHLKITIGILLGAVIGGAIYFRFLERRMYAPVVTEQKAAQHLAQQSLTSPADVSSPVRLYLAEWHVAENEQAEAATEPREGNRAVPARPIVREATLPLASEPSLRAKQLLQAWLAANQESPHSLIPADARLREVFLLPDGTAYVDFSTEFSTHAISGVASEMLVVSALVDTLAGNLTSIQKVKILINGQEAETLAGHVDLDRFYTADPDVVPAKPEEAAPAASDATAQQPPR